MRQDALFEILKKIDHYKKKEGFLIVDSHVHPYDVMGVIHFSDHKLDPEVKKINNDQFFLTPTIIEKFKYGHIPNILSRWVTKFFPDQVNIEIVRSYANISQMRILDEMSLSHIDTAILVPIEPWSKTEMIYHDFNDKKFLHLASIDPHSIRCENIETLITKYKLEGGVKGIKLHPNLQNFDIRINNNKPEVKSNLEKIIEQIENQKLYLLLHGGISFYCDSVSRQYKNIERSRDNAKIEKIFSGLSTIMARLTRPVIISHLGHYGYLNFKPKIISTLCKRYSNIYFDTSGTSPKLIRKMINICGPKRIVFGSDALYNRMAYNLAFCYLAVRGYAKNEKQLIKCLSDIAYNNINFITSLP